MAVFRACELNWAGYERAFSLAQKVPIGAAGSKDKKPAL
jgi:hypothetical protein